MSRILIYKFMYYCILIAKLHKNMNRYLELFLSCKVMQDMGDGEKAEEEWLQGAYCKL
jgi:hypothetical protein